MSKNEAAKRALDRFKQEMSGELGADRVSGLMRPRVNRANLDGIGGNVEHMIREVERQQETEHSGNYAR